tara:strand:- start:443 stop:892 length:450 start_codon:yes stop_codon:yes gene_type:complete
MKLQYHITRLILIFAITILLATGCSGIYHYRKSFDLKRPAVTHVLALTSAGDTVKVPINEIQPKSIYNVIGYDFNNMYPYNRYRYNWYDRYYNYNSNFGHYQGAQNSGSKIQYNNISPPSTPTSSGTSGFSGNPVATNPVTSGGAKKKN